MKEIMDAVYENGVFRPLKTPAIPQGKQVRIEVEVPEGGDPDTILALATSVFDGLSKRDIGEIESIAADRSDFFRYRTQ